MTKFEQFVGSAFDGKTPIEFTFRGAKDLVTKYEALTGEKLANGWKYCIREIKRPTGETVKFLLKASVDEDSWYTLGTLTNCKTRINLPDFLEVFRKAKENK